MWKDEHSLKINLCIHEVNLLGLDSRDPEIDRWRRGDRFLLQKITYFECLVNKTIRNFREMRKSQTHSHHHFLQLCFNLSHSLVHTLACNSGLFFPFKEILASALLSMQSQTWTLSFCLIKGLGVCLLVFVSASCIINQEVECHFSGLPLATWREECFA